MTALLVIGILIVMAVAYYIRLNNRIVNLEETVGNAWSDVDVQLRMRFDLVDNLVETVKGYAKHEKSTFKEIVEARNKFATATDVKSKSDADNMLTTSLKSLFALSEAYPELKSNENFLSLQSELSDIENKIASARRYFNAATREYNTLIKQFPANILFHKEPKDYFEGLEEAKKAPKVKFD
ncbi:LemA family protein [bacterium]|nr:LemA family protein [bacterium]